jgi:hypothetical protein
MRWLSWKETILVTTSDASAGVSTSSAKEEKSMQPMSRGNREGGGMGGG